MLRLSSREDLEVMRKQVCYTRQKVGTTIIVCGGTGCTASKSNDVIEAINKELVLQGMESSVQLRVTGCHGFCKQGPIAVIEPQNPGGTSGRSSATGRGVSVRLRRSTSAVE